MSNILNGTYLIDKTTGEETNTYYNTNTTSSSNKIYCIGPVKKNEYVTTCPVNGCAMRCPVEEIAIGISKSNKKSHDIGVINVKLFS